MTCGLLEFSLFILCFLPDRYLGCRVLAGFHRLLQWLLFNIAPLITETKSLMQNAALNPPCMTQRHESWTVIPVWFLELLCKRPIREKGTFICPGSLIGAPLLSRCCRGPTRHAARRAQRRDLLIFRDHREGAFSRGFFPIKLCCWVTPALTVKLVWNCNYHEQCSVLLLIVIDSEFVPLFSRLFRYFFPHAHYFPA